MSDVDPVTVEIIRNSLDSAAEEMGETLLRTAYSSVIREARDCSTALFDAEGELVAQAEHIPMHLGSMPYALSANFELATELDEGEFLVFNDPYSGGQHIIDIIAFHPAYADGELIGFAGSIAHHIDMGGPGAASLGTDTATSYGEGFRFKPLVIDADSREFDHFVRTLASNVRSSEAVIGDFNAQLSANRRGVTRLREIATKYDVETYRAVLDELDEYAERFVRTRIEDIADATGTASETVEIDAPPALADADTTVQVTVTVDDDELAIDFDGTAPEVPGYINAPIASTHSAAYFAVLATLGGDGLPISAGAYRPISIETRRGTMVDPTEPTATRARMKTCCRVCDAVLGALAEIAPDRVPASAFNSTTPLVFSKEVGETIEVFMDLPGGGWGGHANGDGASATTNLLENEMNIPVEAIEQDHPWLRVAEYSLRENSAGDGSSRGGLGVRRAFEIADGPASGIGYTGRLENGAWGIEGGGSGATGSVFVSRKDGSIDELGTTWSVDLEAGDQFVMEMGGGGGYGEPGDRSLESVARDVRDGNVTLEKATEGFGVDTAALLSELEESVGAAYDAYAAYRGWPEADDRR